MVFLPGLTASSFEFHTARSDIAEQDGFSDKTIPSPEHIGFP